MINRVHAREDGEQDLCGADITGRLFTPDMLFASLDRKAIGETSVPVPRNADESPGQPSSMFVRRREIGRMRTAEAHWHAEALSCAEGDVCSEFAGGCQQCHRQKVCGHDRERAGLMRSLDDRSRVEYAPIAGRILQKDPAAVHCGKIGLVRISDMERYAESFRAGAQDAEGLRMAVFRSKKGAFFPARHREAEAEGLGSGGRFVEQRSVCQRQSC